MGRVSVFLVTLSLLVLNCNAESILTADPVANDAPQVKVSDPMAAYTAMVKEVQVKSKGVPDPNVGDMVANMTDGNPDEMGTYYQGDLLMPFDKTYNKSFRWFQAIVPYQISDKFSPEDRANILHAIRRIQNLTCVRFVPYVLQPDFLSIENERTGCWSALGRVGGRQVINLQSPGCITQNGVIKHQLMHTLGILHEQSRNDRDQFVNIRRDNIMEGKEGNFEVQPGFSGLEQPYDLGSLMHYSLRAFSSNGMKTIEPKLPNSVNIGQRMLLTASDIRKIKKLYSCPARPTIIRRTTPRTIIRTVHITKHKNHQSSPNLYKAIKKAYKSSKKNGK